MKKLKETTCAWVNLSHISRFIAHFVFNLLNLFLPLFFMPILAQLLWEQTVTLEVGQAASGRRRSQFLICLHWQSKSAVEEQKSGLFSVWTDQTSTQAHAIIWTGMRMKWYLCKIHVRHVSSEQTKMLFPWLRHNPPGYNSEYNICFCNVIWDVTVFVSSASTTGILLKVQWKFLSPGAVTFKERTHIM